VEFGNVVRSYCVQHVYINFNINVTQKKFYIFGLERGFKFLFDE